MIQRSPTTVAINVLTIPKPTLPKPKLTPAKSRRAAEIKRQIQELKNEMANVLKIPPESDVA